MILDENDISGNEDLNSVVFGLHVQRDGWGGIFWLHGLASWRG